MNFDDKIIVDDDVEVKYEVNANQNQNQNQQPQNNSYTNNNIRTESFLSLAFSKKYIALTLSTISIILTMFLRFIKYCSVTSLAFYAIWFFLSAGLVATSLIINVINFAKNKKLDFNVSSIITLVAILVLFLA